MPLSQGFLQSKPVLGLAVFTTLLAGTGQCQNSVRPPESGATQAELLSYEGQNVVVVEIAGRPDLNIEQLMPLIGRKPAKRFHSQDRRRNYRTEGHGLV